MKAGKEQHIFDQVLKSEQYPHKINPNKQLHVTSIKKAVENINYQNSLKIIKQNVIEYQNGETTSAHINDLKRLMGKSLNLKQWKYICALKISPTKDSLFQPANISHKQFISLISGIIATFPHLSNLHLEFLLWGAIYDKSLEELGVQIGRKLLNLQYLSLSFKNCWSITEKGIGRLAQEISRNLVRLTHLNLCISYDSQYRRKMTDNGLRTIASEIARHLNNLRHLQFSVRYEGDFSSKGIEDCMSVISSKLTKIQTLKFCFTHYVVSDESFRTLIGLICTNLPNLRHLRLRLGYLDIVPTKSLWFMLENITRHLVHLEHLDFNFSNSINSKLEGHDAYIINQLICLKSLMFRISGGSALESSLLQLASMIQQKFPNLEQLGIKFAHKAILDSLSSKSLDMLIFNTSRSLTKLHTLWINAIFCKLSSPNWKKWLDFKTEKPAPNLRHLTLLFVQSKGITDEFLTSLGGRTAFFFENLETLNIDLRVSDATFKGLEGLFVMINQKLVNLKSVKIATIHEGWKKVFYFDKAELIIDEFFKFKFIKNENNSL